MLNSQRPHIWKHGGIEAALSASGVPSLFMPAMFPPVGLTPFGRTDSDLKGPKIPQPLVFALSGLKTKGGGFFPFQAMNPRPPTKLLISGVTRDSTGTVLATCQVALYLTATDQFLERVTSDANGAFTFSYVGLGQTYYVVAYKTGTPVRGTSDNTLTGTVNG